MLPGDQIQVEVRLLQAQLLEARQKNKQICENAESQMVSFRGGLTVPTDEEYKQIRFIPQEKHDHIQLVQITNYKNVLIQRQEHRSK